MILSVFCCEEVGGRETSNNVISKVQKRANDQFNMENTGKPSCGGDFEVEW